MRIEQLLTLLNIEDGIYRDSGKVLIKKANTITITDESDCNAFAQAINPNLRTASVCDKITLVMPSAVSRQYTQDQLKKIASAYESDKKTLEEKVQDALIRISASKKAIPDLDSLISLAFMMSNSSNPGILTLKFAQWGGTGGMSGNEGGSFKNFSFQPGDVNEAFGRWQANSMFDEMLGSARRNDKTQWAKSTEGKLADSGFYSHKYADENALKYNMTWSERIRHKNLERLRRMFEDRKKSEKKQNEYTPRYIRMNEELNPRHYDSVEIFLEDQRGIGHFDYTPKHGRLDERVPEWHSELATLRRNSKKQSVLEKYSVRVNSDDVFERAPGRRRQENQKPNSENEKNYAGGVTGAGANIMNQPSAAEAETHLNALGTTTNEPTGELSQKDAKFYSSLQNGGERPSVSSVYQGDNNNAQVSSNGTGNLDQPPMFDQQYYPNATPDNIHNETATTEDKLNAVRPQMPKRKSVDDEGKDKGLAQWNDEDEYEGVTDQSSKGRRNTSGQGGWV